MLMDENATNPAARMGTGQPTGTLPRTASLRVIHRPKLVLPAGARALVPSMDGTVHGARRVAIARRPGPAGERRQRPARTGGRPRCRGRAAPAWPGRARAGAGAAR